MPEDSRFFEGRDHSEAEVAEVFQDFSEDGIYQHADQRLAVSAPGGLVVNVAAGRAIVQGFWYRLPVATGVPIPFNNTASIRYDRVVLRLERGPNRVILGLRLGAPGGGIPALERAIGGNWELSLGWVRSGPSVTNITASDIGDERSYASVCGYANRSGYIGAPALDGLPSFAGFFGDSNTGFQNYAEDGINIMTGGKAMATIHSSVVYFGSYNTPVIIRAGGPAGAGYERIYVDGTYILIGRDGSGGSTGPSQIELGTSKSVTAISYGHTGATYATHYIYGSVSFTPPQTNYYLPFYYTEGYYTGIAFRNNGYYNREAYILLNGGLGGQGDLSIYTSGPWSNRLIFGVQGAGKMIIGPNSFAFGNQVGRNSAYNFQAQYNHPDWGIRLFHTNQSHHLDWYPDDTGRHVWGINNTPQMWLMTGGVFTIGWAPKDSGFNFQQQYNHPFWGIRIWHTNAVHALDYYADDSGRHTWGINGVPQMWLFTQGQFTIGGPAPKGAGFNFQQASNFSYYGLRVFHTNGSWHNDFYTDDAGRLRVGFNDAPKFAMAADGKITLGPTPTDVAMLHIPAQFADGESNGIRFTAGGAAGRVWVHSNGMFHLGSATCYVIVQHSPLAFTPGTASNVELGTTTLPWNNLYIAAQGYKAGGGSWAALSDERMKLSESIRPFTDGIDRLMQFEPIWFRYSGEYNVAATERDYVGFSAQRMLQVAPEMVETLSMKRNDDTDEEDVYAVDTSPLIFMLLNAVKDIETRLRALEGRA